MSDAERQHNHENQEAQSAETYEHIPVKTPERLEHLKTPEEKQREVHEIRQAVESEKPAETDEQLMNLNPVKEEKPVHPPNAELRKVALNNYLGNIRDHLKGPSKAYSKFIHGDKVNAISEVTGKTIVRPTAILFGGGFMFVGSALYLYATYHTDAHYNFFVAFFLFVGGFVAGLIIELLYRLFFHKSI